MRALSFMGYKKGESVTQSSLFPPCLDELIPADHLVRVIAAYVDSLSLESLGFSKAIPASTGRPAYDPADLLKLYLYGYFFRIRSSRRLEAECQRNTEVMWLLGRLTPDFKTIAEFRRCNGKAFVAICRAFVQFCRQANLISGALLAIDGSKFQAVASRRQHITPAKLQKQQAALEQKIAQYLSQLDQDDRAEAAVAPEPDAVRAALQQLQQRHADTLAQQQWLCEQGLQQHIKTEPDARLMRTAKGMAVSYNVQTAVDGQHGLIAHHAVTQEGSDNQQLLPMAQAAQAVLQQEAVTVVADAGYSNGEQFQGCEDHQITAYVPANRASNNQGEQRHFDRAQFVYEAEHDRYRCPHRQELTRKQVNRGSVVYAAQAAVCAACPLKPQCTDAAQRFVTRHAHEAAFERMERRLAAEPDMMVKRRCIVEHPFGNLKQWIFGNGRFLLRGLEGAGSEMALGVTVYNLKRAIAVLGVPRLMALLT
jgi:transposase